VRGSRLGALGHATAGTSGTCCPRLLVLLGATPGGAGFPLGAAFFPLGSSVFSPPCGLVSSVRPTAASCRLPAEGGEALALKAGPSLLPWAPFCPPWLWVCRVGCSRVALLPQGTGCCWASRAAAISLPSCGAVDAFLVSQEAGRRALPAVL